MQFCRKAQEAAEFAALPKSLAQGLIGAMRELEDNVHLHSRRAHDGLVAFRSTTDEFEFVVTDSGIGVLQGLREVPRYAHLTDAGAALKTTLTDGQSRLLDVDPGRGFGFTDFLRPATTRPGTCCRTQAVDVVMLASSSSSSGAPLAVGELIHWSFGGTPSPA